MDDQEKREAYLTARGWSRISVYFWKRDGKTGSHNIDSAVDQQLYKDADIAIDAMLRLPALEAKLARIAALVDSMHHNSLEEPESGSLCVDHGDFNALREEVTHG